MKKTFLVTLISLIVVAAATFFILNSQTYSMLDIDADNFRQKLKLSSHGIYEAQITWRIPDKIDLELGSRTLSDRPYGNNITVERSERFNDSLNVTYRSNITGLTYITLFRGDKLLACVIQGYDKTTQLKEICDKLLLNGFILRKSVYKGGMDILIMETETHFIIADLSGSYDESPGIMSINIFSYNKKKYFN
jgi:aminopeptidase C